MPPHWLMWEQRGMTEEKECVRCLPHHQFCSQCFTGTHCFKMLSHPRTLQFFTLDSVLLTLGSFEIVPLFVGSLLALEFVYACVFYYFVIVYVYFNQFNSFCFALFHDPLDQEW